jgi:hypothetical protein
MHEKDSETIAIQTEGGLLYRTTTNGHIHGRHTQGHETAMHWVPAGLGSTGFLVDKSEHFAGFLPLPFDTNTTMLIGCDEGEQVIGKKPWQTLPCFEANRHCQLSPSEYRHVSKASQLVYLGTSERYWKVDKKAMNISTGWSGSSLGASRTWNVRPATSRKASMLLYCAQPGRNIEPLMDLRVGLEWSICTSNARRISLLDALTLAFPEEKAAVKGLLRYSKKDQSSR